MSLFLNLHQVFVHTRSLSLYLGVLPFVKTKWFSAFTLTNHGRWANGSDTKTKWMHKFLFIFFGHHFMVRFTHSFSHSFLLPQCDCCHRRQFIFTMILTCHMKRLARTSRGGFPANCLSAALSHEFSVRFIRRRNGGKNEIMICWARWYDKMESFIFSGINQQTMPNVCADASMARPPKLHLNGMNHCTFLT